MSHFIAAVLFQLLVLYLGALYESTALALLAFALAVITVLSLFLLLYRLWAVEVELSIPMALGETEKPLAAAFTVRTKREMFGRTRIEVQVLGRGLPGKQVQRTWIGLAAPRIGEETHRRFVTMQHAGAYEYRLRRVRVYDWTGWFYLTKPLKATAVTQLLPKVHEIPLQLSGAVRGFFGEAEVYDDRRGGSDASETFQIREYVPGDRLQNIHWKLSAKTDELMVREHSQPKGCPVALLLGAKGVEKLSSEQRDRFLQAAASLSFSLVDAECPHIVSWYDGTEQDVVRTRVDDEESFYEWQLLYLSARAERTDCEVEARYVEKYHREPLLHRLRLEPDLSLYVDGKLLHTFAKKGRIEKEFETLELYL